MTPHIHPFIHPFIVSSIHPFIHPSIHRFIISTAITRCTETDVLMNTTVIVAASTHTAANDAKQRQLHPEPPVPVGVLV
jgi:hypothetical protein